MPVLNKNIKELFYKKTKEDILYQIDKEFIESVTAMKKNLEDEGIVQWDLMGKYMSLTDDIMSMKEDTEEYNLKLDEMDDIWWELSVNEQNYLEKSVVKMAEEKNANNK